MLRAPDGGDEGPGPQRRDTPGLWRGAAAGGPGGGSGTGGGVPGHTGLLGHGPGSAGAAVA